MHPRRDHHRSARQYQAFPRRPGRPCPAARRPEEECHQEAPARRSLSDWNRRTPPLQSMAWNHQPWGCPPVAAHLMKGCRKTAHPKRCCHLAAGPPRKDSPEPVHPRWRTNRRPAAPMTDHRVDSTTVHRSAAPRMDPRPARHRKGHRPLAGAAHFRSCRRKNPATGCRCSSARPAARKNSPWGFHRSAARRTGSDFGRDFRSCHRRTNQSVPAQGTASPGRIPDCLAPPAARARTSPGSPRRSWATRAKTRVRKARTTATKVRTTVRTRATPEAAASRWMDPPSCSRPARPGRPGVQASRILSASS